MPPVVPPFLIGLIAAPLAKRVVKPLMRGLVKTSVGLVLEVKRAAQEAGEGLQDLAAEVTAEVVAAQMGGSGQPDPLSHPQAQSGAQETTAAVPHPKGPAKGRTAAVGTGKAN
ncbi:MULTISPECIES: DUF5132 domain-containing protein [unclassified Streptomyces]|uniref:DUF5132 domain-containing protein n=1 Tax=unclassified Streptomyces TaxID=2593676 RepID=UPI0029A32BE1|nr:DUF5132 domain-containing protein [Streptomyces sp. ME18-1-4]MDX3245475.1 DUF5132 domain-containing protein [Streptomyces sp. ME18-1-4]